MIRDQQKRLLHLAEQLRLGQELNNDQRLDLAQKLEDIGRGGDPSEILGLKYKRGNSISDEKRRENLRLIFHWIEGAIDKELGLGMSLNKAMEKAASLSNKKNTPFKPIAYSSLKKAWYNPRYRYLRGVNVNKLDPSSPY